MDQTPISFEFLDRKTYSTKGSKTVWVKTARSGWEKRQATIQIVLHADGVLRCKPLLIFKGKGGYKGKPFHPSLLAEWKQYDSRVKVAFNDKAYATTETMIEWVKSQFSYSSAFVFKKWEDKHEPRLLTLDVFKGQLNDIVLAEFKRINCTCSFIPGGTTGFIQVCDVGINKVLKNRIQDLADKHYDSHETQWIEGKYSVGQRRVMLVNWVAQAWEDLHKYDSKLIRQTFTDLGLTLPTDGSQDDKIKIKDLPGLKVGDWQNWKPTDGCLQPSDTLVTPWIDTVMTNKTIEKVDTQAEEAEQPMSDSDSDSDDSDGDSSSDNSGIEQFW